MALTRKLLKGMGLSEEQIDSIIDAHTDTVDTMKDRIKALEGDAEGAKELQKQLDALKGGKDWKAEHDKVKKEFDQYKADVAGKEQSAKMREAYRALLKEEKIDERIYDLAMKGTDFSGMKLTEDGKLENAEALREAIRKDYDAFRVKTEERGAQVGNPPAGGKAAPTKAEIMAIKDKSERVSAIAQNLELFKN